MRIVLYRLALVCLLAWPARAQPGKVEQTFGLESMLNGFPLLKPSAPPLLLDAEAPDIQGAALIGGIGDADGGDAKASRFDRFDDAAPLAVGAVLTGGIEQAHDALAVRFDKSLGRKRLVGMEPVAIGLPRAAAPSVLGSPGPERFMDGERFADYLAHEIINRRIPIAMGKRGLMPYDLFAGKPIRAPHRSQDTPWPLTESRVHKPWSSRGPGGVRWEDARSPTAKLWRWLLAQRDGSVAPHDLFLQSLEAAGGNVTEALIAGWNVLSVGRAGSSERLSLRKTKKLIDLRGDAHLAPLLHDPDRPIAWTPVGDNFSAWYHFWGTMLHSFVYGQRLTQAAIVLEENILYPTPDNEKRVEIDWQGAAAGARLSRNLKRLGQVRLSETARAAGIAQRPYLYPKLVRPARDWRTRDLSLLSPLLMLAAWAAPGVVVSQALLRFLHVSETSAILGGISASVAVIGLLVAKLMREFAAKSNEA